MAVPPRGSRDPEALSEGFQGNVSGKRFLERCFSMARPPKPYYTRNAWRTAFGGEKTRALAGGPKTPDTRPRGEKDPPRRREGARLFQQCPALETPFAIVVEQFLENYAGRPAY